MRNRAGIFAAFLIVIIVHAGFVTYWTWRPLGNEVRNEAYDSIGSHLIEGNAEADEAAINWEGFHVNGKMYAYFGPFPDLLRIVPNIAFPSMH